MDGRLATIPIAPAARMQPSQLGLRQLDGPHHMTLWGFGPTIFPRKQPVRDAVLATLVRLKFARAPSPKRTVGAPLDRSEFAVGPVPARSAVQPSPPCVVWGPD